MPTAIEFVADRLPRVAWRMCAASRIPSKSGMRRLSADRVAGVHSRARGGA